ncbi:Tetratricopeptide TPR1 [Pelomyxa schiedti]|nr:Tetratricopeptide TPR1 [Pelomyxa schiedti]
MKPVRRARNKAQQVARLLSQAATLVDEGDADGATEKYERALKIDPNCTIAMDGLGELRASIGDVDRARELFVKSIQKAPDSGASKYFNLSQLCDSEGEALQYHRKGITILSRDLTMVNEGKLPGNAKEMTETLCSAYSSFAELFLSNNYGTEEECEEMLRRGLVLVPTHYELLQTLASLRITQSRQPEALELLKNSYSQWSKKDLEDWPTYAFCHNTAKMFVELGEHRSATDILEGMLELEDNIAEVWHLLSLAYSYFDLPAAFESLKRTQELMTRLEEPDEELEAEVASLVKRLTELDPDGKIKAECDEQENEEEAAVDEDDDDAGPVDSDKEESDSEPDSDEELT